MKSRLPAAQIQATWEALANQAGPFQEITDVRREQVQGMETVIVTCKFQRGDIDVRVVFDPDKKVAGLFMTPAGQAPMAPAQSSTPAEPAAAPGTPGAAAPGN